MSQCCLCPGDLVQKSAHNYFVLIMSAAVRSPVKVDTPETTSVAIVPMPETSRSSSLWSVPSKLTSLGLMFVSPLPSPKNVTSSH